MAAQASIGSRVSRRRFLGMALSTGVALAAPLLTRCTPAPTPPATVLEVVPRADWGATAPDIAGSVEGTYDAITNPGGVMLYAAPLRDVLTCIVVHHTALPLKDGPREIQQKHMQGRGYADIGYHYVIDDAGQIYEGRNLYYRGAHTGGHNTGTVGIVLTGNFEEIQPTPAQIERLIVLSRALGYQFALTHLAGHRDFQPGVTVCPGRHLAAQLPAVAAQAKLTLGTEGYRGL